MKNYDKSNVSAHNLGQIEGKQVGATEACSRTLAASDNVADSQDGLKCEQLTILLNVDELWLKGKNRARYQQRLQNQVRQICKHYHASPFTLKNQNQRLILSSEEKFSPSLLFALKNLPGLFTLQPARVCSTTLEAIEQCACAEMEAELGRNPEGRTFRVSAHRSFKDFPLTSMEVDRRVGTKILSQFPTLKVDLENSDIELQIKIADADQSYATAQKIEGVGGFPVGSSGKLVTLLSGGFDSPVASYLMSARGCQQIFAFFHAYPFVGDEVKSKILDLSKVLARYQIHSQLFTVPFGSIQNLIAQNCQERYRTLLFRYAMLLSGRTFGRTKVLRCLVHWRFPGPSFEPNPGQPRPPGPCGHATHFETTDWICQTGNYPQGKKNRHSRPVERSPRRCLQFVCSQKAGDSAQPRLLEQRHPKTSGGKRTQRAPLPCAGTIFTLFPSLFRTGDSGFNPNI